MTDKEAMKLALEALEGVLDDAPKVLDASISGGLYEVVQCRDAITALKEVLAQETALQALHSENERLGLYKDVYAEPESECNPQDLCAGCRCKYAHVQPEPIQSLQCFHCQVTIETLNDKVMHLLAQRKPLTEEQIWKAIRPLATTDQLCKKLIDISMDEYRAIEVAHGIKENT